MWFPVSLLLLVGVAVARIQYGEYSPWETQNEYRYLLRSRTLAGLDNSKEQYTGIQLQGLLTIQVKSPERLLAKLSNPQYARIHKALLHGPESEIPDQNLEYREMPMSGKPFELKLKNGVIQDLLVEPNVPTWEVNVLKSIAGQLQIDIQAKNPLEDVQMSNTEQPSLLFTTMEDSVGGRCEVLYDITPLSENVQEEKPELISIPGLGKGQHMEIKKVKNFNKCQQRSGYGINSPMRKLTKPDGPLSQLSETRMIISGNLKQFTIQSVVTRDQISVKGGSDSPFGTVHSMMKLTLIKKDRLSNPSSELSEISNLESTGNLVYTYNNPLSDSENQRESQRLRLLNSWNSNEKHSSSSSSSSSSNSLHRMSSSSSSSSSSSEESYNKRPVFHQPEAALHLAPNVPLLPFSIGYKGKSILRSDKIDAVAQAQQLISEITNELQTPTQKLSQDTLEKYTILKNLLRVMNLQQYTDLTERILCSKDRKHQIDVCSVLRDAVAEAGTGPALLTIRNWIKTTDYTCGDWIRVLLKIPKVVPEPSPEYIKTFFEMISEPRTAQQKCIHFSGLVAFAELIRINHVNQKHKSELSVGPVKSEDMVDRYIPHLAQQLEQGLLENDNIKIQTSIVALSATGHPSVLPVLEPYLEGTKTMTKLQRILMVTAMSNIAKIHPKLVGPIFYKLYLDPKESHEIRSIAVQQFIMTNPPLITLQRIAKYTNIEKNVHVNSIVKTTIESLAKMGTQRPEWLELANKARSVRYLLSPESFDSFSRGYHKQLENWLIKGLNLKTVASDDNPIPVFAQLNVQSTFDRLDQSTLESGYMVSSVNQLMRQLMKTWQQWNREEKEESSPKSQIEKLAQRLNIKSEQMDKLEGNVFVNTLFGSSIFVPFDNHVFEDASHWMKSFLKKSEKKVESTLINNFERTMSISTETGLPFVYSMETPTVIKLLAEMKEDSTGPQRNGVLKVLLANKVQKRFGFVTPFEHQTYITGIDDNKMVQVPLEYEVNFDLKQQNLALKLRPSSQKMDRMDSQVPLMHYSVVPFTTQQDILDLQPAFLDRNTHEVLNSKKHKAMLQKDLFSIKVESDDDFMNKEIEKKSSSDLSNVAKLQQWNNSQYKKVDVSMNTEQRKWSEMRINIAYESSQVGEYDKQSYEQEEPNTLQFDIEDWKPNSKDRRHQIMKALGTGLRSGKVHVIDINYDVPILHEQQVFTVGVVNSNVDSKTKAYVYWNAQSLNSEERTREVCYGQQRHFSPETPLDFEYALKHPRRDTIWGNLRYGVSCKEGHKIGVVANVTRSEELTQLLEKSKIVKECREEIRKGYKTALVCQKAISIAQREDQLDFSVAVSESVRETIYYLIEVAANFVSKMVHVELDPNRSSEPNVISGRMTLVPYDFKPSIFIATPNMDITYPTGPGKSTMQSQQQLDRADTLFENEMEKNSCTLDNDRIITFDKRVYPVMMADVEHVLMTTYPQQDPDNRRYMAIPESLRTAILVKDTDEGKRITLLLGAREVAMLMKVNGRVEAVVNGQIVEVTKQKRFYDRTGEYYIIRLPDESLQVISDKHGVSCTFDGENVRLFVSDVYRNSIRGLCGNYDSNPNNDFITPRNCILTKPEEFSAMYALIQEGSQGPVVENKLKAEKAHCKDLSKPVHRNLINDKHIERALKKGHKHNSEPHDRDRSDTIGHRKYSSEEVSRKPSSRRERQNIVYRTKVLEDHDDKICFTTKPIPTCREGTTPTEKPQSKEYRLYCLSKNAESLAIQDRVERGANPDFSRKPVSRSHVFQVPSACRAA